MNWYETAFHDEYLSLYFRRDDESAQAEAEFASKAMGLGESSLLLDVACGAGRHARAFAGMGHRVVGVDLSAQLLARATGVTRVRGDMRALPFAGGFDAATCFFTSFGYFDHDDNRRALESMVATLRPRGVFLLDFLNATEVMAKLRPQSTVERDGKTFDIRRRIENGRVLKEVTVRENGRERRYTESVRLYLHIDLVMLLKRAGLHVAAAYGDFDGSDYTTCSPRCILVASKG